MAHTKSQGATKGNRDSNSKRLGIKVYGGQKAMSGNILIRQRGTKVHPGEGVMIGNDFTIFAIKTGIVEFKKRLGKQVVSVA